MHSTWPASLPSPSKGFGFAPTALPHFYAHFAVRSVLVSASIIFYWIFTSTLAFVRLHDRFIDNYPPITLSFSFSHAIIIMHISFICLDQFRASVRHEILYKSNNENDRLARPTDWQISSFIAIIRQLECPVRVIKSLEWIKPLNA